MPPNTLRNCRKRNTMPTNGKPRWKRCCWSQNKADRRCSRATAMLLRGSITVIIAEGHWGIADINQEPPFFGMPRRSGRNLSPRDNQSTTRQSLSSPCWLLCSDAGDPLRGSGIDALHRHIDTVLAQYQGCCLSVRFGDETDLGILIGEFGIASSIDRQCRLARQLSIQLLAGAGNRHHGTVVQLIESDMAIEYLGIRDALRCGLTGVA